jgi:tetratricopeptide (TPR) repeat protein
MLGRRPGFFGNFQEWLGIMGWLLSFPFRALDAIGRATWSFFGQWFRSHPLPGYLLGLPIRTLGLLAILLWTFLRRWCSSRPLPALLRGLPIVLVSLAVFCLGSATQVSRSDLLERYRRSAAKAADRGNTAAAALWLEKASLLRPDDLECQFRLAVAADRDGRPDRSRAILRRIAPADAKGYPRAHFWLAKEMLQRRASLTAKEEEALEHHLEHALEDPANRPEAYAMLGQFYLRRGDLDRAIAQLERSAAESPVMLVTLAQMYKLQQRTQQALSAARKGRDFFREKVTRNPEAAAPRIQWALAEQVLGNYAEAVRILEEGLQYSDQKQALVAAYLRWYDALLENESGNLAKRLALLDRALVHGPEDPRLLGLLAKLATRDWDRPEEAYSALRSILAFGGAPITIHLILGSQALKRGEFENGLMHLELAGGRNAHIPRVLNNLARRLAHEEDGDLEHALQLVRAANELSDEPEIYEAAGTILARMGRYREAVAALETALRTLPERRDLHAQLAEWYDQLGDRTLAQEHRRLAAPPAGDDTTNSHGR